MIPAPAPSLSHWRQTPRQLIQEKKKKENGGGELYPLNVQFDSKPSKSRAVGHKLLRTVKIQRSKTNQVSTENHHCS